MSMGASGRQRSPGRTARSRRGAGRLALLALLLAGAAGTAAATDLLEVWQAALRNDREHAVGRAAQAAAQPRRDQAAALWRPTVGLSASAGLASSESDTRGAQFSAPGFGQSGGVGFSTSVTGGTSTRWALSARQPLFNPERRIRQQQLSLSADQADLEWAAAGQSLALRTSERYFELALAEETVRVLRQQLDAVQRAAVEAQDRFDLGSVPVTGIHEARARLADLRAQLLAAEADAQIRRNVLADSTGLPAARLTARLPGSSGAGKAVEALEPWLADAQSGHPEIRARRLAAEVARQEAGRYSRRAATSVDLVAQVGRERLSGSGDFGAASQVATNGSVAVQLSMPLFTGGYRVAREQEALRLADKAQAEVERMREQVAQQVRAAWLGLGVGAERIQALDEALRAGVARLDATQVGYEVGQRTTLDLLNAQNETATIRLALARARVDLLLDRLRLHALAGRLDEGALQAANRDLAAPAQR